MSTLAHWAQQMENTTAPTTTGFATMRLMSGHVYLNGCPSDETVLDSGASLSMMAEEFVTTCALEQTLRAATWPASLQTTEQRTRQRGSHGSRWGCHCIFKSCTIRLLQADFVQLIQ